MMDWTYLLATLHSTQTPVLPEPSLDRAYLALGWALVLSCAGVWLVRRLRFGRGARWLVAGLLMLWTLWPGDGSPSYWLGLAFRAPSLSSSALCGWLLWRFLMAPARPALPPRAGGFLVAVGIVLGWLLLLDTFAVWPVSFYAWGFSPVVTSVLALLACIPWLLGGARTRLSWVGLVLLLTFVLLRLPTGNLWDAVLDPWLWGGLHLGGLLWLWRRWRGRPAA